VVDERDAVGELVGLLEVLRAEQDVVPSATNAGMAVRRVGFDRVAGVPDLGGFEDSNPGGL
jgi:hypothetical protein